MGGSSKITVISIVLIHIFLGIIILLLIIGYELSI